MSVAVCTGTLICFLFSVAIKWKYQGGKIKQLEWDMATVTAGDYAVEFPIPKAVYQNWYNATYANGQN